MPPWASRAECSLANGAGSSESFFAKNKVYWRRLKLLLFNYILNGKGT